MATLLLVCLAKDGTTSSSLKLTPATKLEHSEGFLGTPDLTPAGTVLDGDTFLEGAWVSKSGLAKRESQLPEERLTPHLPKSVQTVSPHCLPAGPTCEPSVVILCVLQMTQLVSFSYDLLNPKGILFTQRHCLLTVGCATKHRLLSCINLVPQHWVGDPCTCL